MTHQELVTKFCKPGTEIRENMSAVMAHCLHMAVGIAGEAGEIIDTVKKYAIYDIGLDRQNIIEELGDLEFFMEGLRQELGITREQCLEENIRKLMLRYGDKYSNESAKERRDKIGEHVH